MEWGTNEWNEKHASSWIKQTKEGKEERKETKACASLPFVLSFLPFHTVQKEREKRVFVFRSLVLFSLPVLHWNKTRETKQRTKETHYFDPFSFLFVPRLQWMERSVKRGTKKREKGCCGYFNGTKHAYTSFTSFHCFRYIKINPARNTKINVPGVLFFVLLLL